MEILFYICIKQLKTTKMYKCTECGERCYIEDMKHFLGGNVCKKCIKEVRTNPENLIRNLESGDYVIENGTSDFIGYFRYFKENRFALETRYRYESLNCDDLIEGSYYKVYAYKDCVYEVKDIKSITDHINGQILMGKPFEYKKLY